MFQKLNCFSVLTANLMCIIEVERERINNPSSLSHISYDSNWWLMRFSLNKRRVRRESIEGREVVPF